MSKQHWKFEPSERWVRATLNGETIVDSRRVKLMHESPGELDYFFPMADVRREFLVESDEAQMSGYRGRRCFWHLRLGDDLYPNAAWTYAVQEGRPDFSGYIAFDWDVMDYWFEENEEVLYGPRNPYHRIDTIASSRHVEVFVDGIKVADTTRPTVVFETYLPARYYIPEEDIARQFLYHTNSETICPYKGFASYYNLIVNGETYEDTVWVYPDPIPEAPKLKNLLAFWPEKDGRIEIVVDGETTP